MIAEVSWRTTDRLATLDELDALLDWITKQVLPEMPQAVNIVRPNGDCLTIVIGAPSGSCVSFISNSGNPPYFVSLGDPTANGIFTFYVEQDHHSEGLARNVISQAEARQAVREFVLHPARLPRCVTWTEV
ncbi:MAG: Imm1 family immunity protein [Pirellulales bacterium]